jgi:hypothetical protein
MRQTLDKQTTQNARPPDAAREGDGRRHADPDVCMEVIKVLDSFTLEKRPETLNGAIPLRAAQGCKPFLDGNAAGFHLRLTDPAVIRTGRGGPSLVLSDEGYAKATADYDSQICRLVERGIIEEGGYWQRELSKGFA